MQTDKVTVYQDSKGLWRWRWVSGANGKVLADSGQGYKRRLRAELAADRIINSRIYDVRAVVVTE